MNNFASLKFFKFIIGIGIIYWYLKFFLLPISADYLNYVSYLNNLQDLTLKSSFTLSRFEPSSVLLFWLSIKIFSPQETLLLIGLVSLCLKYQIFLKRLDWPIIAFGWYLVTIAYLHDANQLRLAIATIFMFAIMLSPDTKYNSRNLVFSLIAMSFHYTGIICFVFYFSRRPIFLITPLIFFLIFKEFFISQLLIFDTLRFWLANPAKYNATITNPLFICQSFLLIILFLYWHKLTVVQKKSGILLIFGVCIYIIFLDNPIIAHRVREISQLGIVGLTFVKSRLSLFPRMSFQLIALLYFVYTIHHINEW